MIRNRMREMALELASMVEPRLREHIRGVGNSILRAAGEPPAAPAPSQETEIDKLTRAHRDLKRSVSGIVYTRNKLSTEIEEKEQVLREVEADLTRGASVAAQEVLQGREVELAADLAILRAEYAQVSDLAERLKGTLLRLQATKASRVRAQERAERRATTQAVIETAEGVLLQFPEVA
jgi:predicted RNase H-like nuclease (RuvC/YqgF family)